jgi:5-methyltetrahydrofolate--homocysteine methyltransferase
MGQQERVKELTRKALAENLPPPEIINAGLVVGMDEVGRRFKHGEMFVPEVILSAKAMHAGLDILRPVLTSGALPSSGTVVLGTVQGDLHDIGKNLVAMMLEAGGFKVINLGVDVSPEKFIDAAEEHGADIIGMSALLTTTMRAMRDCIEILEEEGIRHKFKVIVGGAPVSADFAAEIGADGYAPDAASAVDLCRRLLA